MAKHTKTSSQETLLESLKSQNTQIQADLRKLTEEMKETKQYLEGKMTATDERFNELQEMFINLMRKQSGKESMLETGQSSAQPNPKVEVGSEKNGRNVGTDGE
jgi:transcriptional regulator of heat shock response